ncbi:MAG: tail fiber domain-containing protein [Dysgonamonadaceae bacterium]|jgi:hypothetical protein|nr:tail fiber domain-containing protein [Dysgonamonadaceae bacterium]
MKKLVFTITMIVFAFIANVSAQVKVNSTGEVGIGTEDPQYLLDVAGDTHVTGKIYLETGYGSLSTISTSPITFMVNNVLAGYTGYGGGSNVSFGYGAKTGGYANTAIGLYALYGAQSCAHNTAVGGQTLYNIREGDGNTAIGEYALNYSIDGSYNTAVGYEALKNNTYGNYNTAIGAYAGPLSSQLNYSTAIGYGAQTNADNQVRIGHSSVTSIGGYAAWTNLSDKRAKKNIRTNVPGLAFINLLQPVTFNLDLDAIDGLLNIDPTKKSGEKLSPALTDLNSKAREAKEKVIQTGFIAQDVEKMAQSIGYDFSGVDVDATGIYGLRYAEFVVPLVKAVQELSEQNNRLQEQNDRMQEQINELTGVVLQGKELAPGTLRSGNTTGGQDIVNSGASLQQNSPNPFSQSTQIKFYLPQSIKKAFLNIYNLQGKQLKQFAVTQRGEGSQQIVGSELEPGIYLYALIADGQEVDVKRMILTE